MATTVCTRAAPPPGRTATPPLSINTSPRGTPAPVPNKHLPFCSPGPRPSPRNSPLSPPSASQLEEARNFTYPPNGFEKLLDEPTIYAITAEKLETALDSIATQPLPNAGQVFPWLHGLHAENQLQLAFFTARKKSLRRTPKCIRGLTIVKAGGDLSHSKLKGAIAPEEVLRPLVAKPKRGQEEGVDQFLDIDPKDGFSVRNFQIQACKMATVSDIVVYGDLKTSKQEVYELARRISLAQAAWSKHLEPSAEPSRLFNTFVLEDSYEYVETDHPDLVALDSEGCITNKVMDFFHWERLEMCIMSAPSEISHNVWLGPSPDPSLVDEHGECFFKDDQYDLMIETSDLAQIPEDKTLKALDEYLERKERTKARVDEVPFLEFPGSGAILPPTWSQSEVDGLMTTCEWIHKQAHGTAAPAQKRRDSKLSLSPSPDRDVDGDSAMQDASTRRSGGRKVLIHCADGYTESSLLGLAYYMYAECVTAHDAWLHLHREKKRNFFAYGSDVALLRAIQPRLMQASPKYAGEIQSLCPSVPDWMEKMDGSLPSRILPYMYLGNLAHANNPSLLQELGIGQILSVGEPVAWEKKFVDTWPMESLLFVDKVQDNGVDPLTEEFGRCLEFIENGRKKGTATLVHCRVGVSRSATICIAEVMNELGLSFPRAYCFVRARRLNVIIQPHLRFSYELLKWEEFQCQKRGKPLRRELEWASIAREIAAMNKPYSRQN